MDKSGRPGPEATTWENDYRLMQFWLGQCLAAWDAVPVEFRGEATSPNTLIEKVNLMNKEIIRLRLLVTHYETFKE